MFVFAARLKFSSSQSHTLHANRLRSKVIETGYKITSAQEGGYVFGSVCLSVCLFVCLSVGLLANL